MIEKTIKILNYIFAFSIPFTHIAGYAVSGIGFFLSWSFWKKLRSDKFFFWLKIFMIYGLLRTVFSTEPVIGYNTMMGYFSHWILPFMLGYALGDILLVRRSFWVYYITFSVLIGLSVLAYFGLFFKTIGQDFYLAHEGLLKGLHSHIALAAISLMLSFFSLAHFLYNSEFSGAKRKLFLFMSLFFLGAIFLCGSRGYYVSTFLTYLAFSVFIFMNRKVNLRRLIIGTASILLAILVLQFLSPDIRARIRNTTIREGSIQERVSLYKVALWELKSKPLFGFGPGQGKRQKAFFEKLPDNRKNVSRHPHLHSFYLNFLADFGLIGGILLFLIFYSMLAKLRLLYLSEEVFTRTLCIGLIWGIIGIFIGDFLDTLLDGPRVAMDLFWLTGMVFGAVKNGKIK
ncbi:MAG: O-antigen ligase family protein [Endomicrobiales bacterium]|nr:O-antigen ligase family protein [Endomicrobiales bacterium]